MNNLVIGKDLFSEYSNFQGMMDDLRIYNREIQAEEILKSLTLKEPKFISGVNW